MRLAVRTTTHTSKAFSRQGQVRSRSTSRARSSNASAAVAYFGVGGALALYTLDEKLDLRQWKHVSHAIDGSSSVSIRSRVRAGNGEAGQGCVDWPAGRVLLQWALDGGLPLRGESSFCMYESMRSPAVVIPRSGSQWRADMSRQFSSAV